MTARSVLKVPGPRSLPALGSVVALLRFLHDSVGYSQTLFRQYGRAVSLVSGGRTRLYSPLPNCPGTVLVYGSELIHQVAAQADIFCRFPLSGPLYADRYHSPRTQVLNHFGVGLFGVNRDEHRRQRQLIMPAFHKQKLSSYMGTMIDLTYTTLDRWPVGRLLDIGAAMRLLTMRIATKTLFGDDIGEAGARVGALIQRALRMVVAPSVLLYRRDIPGTPYYRFLNLVAQITYEMRVLISQRKVAGVDGNDILSMLIQATHEEDGGILSEDELIGHTGVFFAAGHETSATSLTWTLFLLAQHPSVMADLLDEIESVLRGGAPTVEQLQQLPFLDSVVKESLRLLPPVVWNGRVAVQTVELGGYQIPEGTEIFMSIYETHRNPELYPDPMRFYPQRWDTLAPSAYDYCPFGVGPRMCIGANFALMEIKVVLASLLQRYQLECVPGLRVDRAGLVVVGPKQPMLMRLHPGGQLTKSAGNLYGNVLEMVQLPAREAGKNFN